ncbi:hypothetical protein KR51_00035330 [Rubidibacter lacunae KORDI 51-2]|uniref:Uncharacterized protein n=1 Tax=Rubidibacter lacunae KORDI 51-2 TaxID=582515 RepID=U5DJS2_9CHRO|nr:COP23 domain-containing protein [Rubidibacter lacunae]ERN39935.1 hypothetical protein KR51_00035330 [Rubidibacter lacunae KORDI 51-2]
MNAKLAFLSAIGVALTLGAGSAIANPVATDAIAQASEKDAVVTFSCDQVDGQPVTLASIDRSGSVESRPVLNWDDAYFTSAEETEQICQQVASKLQSYYDNGELAELTLVAEDVAGEPTVCLEQEQDSGCSEGRVLFSFSNVSNPQFALNNIMEPEDRTTQVLRGDFKARLGFGFLPF